MRRRLQRSIILSLVMIFAGELSAGQTIPLARAARRNPCPWPGNRSGRSRPVADRYPPRRVRDANRRGRRHANAPSGPTTSWGSVRIRRSTGIYFASGHPADGGNLGVIRSSDGGAGWELLDPGVGGPVDFHQLDVSKSDPSVLYGVYGTLQVSRDGGETWLAVAEAPPGLDRPRGLRDGCPAPLRSDRDRIVAEHRRRCQLAGHALIAEPVSSIATTAIGEVLRSPLEAACFEGLSHVSSGSRCTAASARASSCISPSIRTTRPGFSRSPKGTSCWEVATAARAGPRSLVLER